MAWTIHLEAIFPNVQQEMVLWLERDQPIFTDGFKARRKS